MPNEYGEPSRGLPSNQFYARVTNSGSVSTGGYRVTFSAKPCTTSAVAPAVEIAHADETDPLAPGASRSSHVTWNLSDAWVHPNFDSMFWSADHFCVVASIGAAGPPLTDVDTANNSAQNNFDNIPMSEGVSGVAEAQFFIYNHHDHPGEAGLVGLARAPSWSVRFEGIADPAHIPLGPRQWLPVRAIAVPSDGAPRPRRGAPVLVEVSQELDGETVGGLTFAVQPPDFAQPAVPAAPRYWFGVRGGSWPLSPMTDRFDPGSHLAADLERALTAHLRLGLEAG